jgi:hypothetical protein
VGWAGEELSLFGEEVGVGLKVRVKGWREGGVICAFMLPLI